MTAAGPDFLPKADRQPHPNTPLGLATAVLRVRAPRTKGEIRPQLKAHRGALLARCQFSTGP